MTKAKAKKIFDKYNPEDGVTRCPNGRAIARKKLDTCAKAAVNLYGIISKKEFAAIFNRQQADHTTADELVTLLLPLVLKSKDYCFYKDYIVHYWAIDDFDFAEFLLREQADKPRYVPDRDEFLKFERLDYEDDTQRRCWWKLRAFCLDTWPDDYGNISQCYREIKAYVITNSGINEIGGIFKKYGVGFPDEESLRQFFDLLMEAKSNTRIMVNKGHTPLEMFNLLNADRPKTTEPQVQLPRDVNANDPCPCGSGKKYKNCCRLIEESKSAQLSQSECALFYETWYGLMGFINDKMKILDVRIRPVYPNPIRDEQIYKIREKLWENPSLIDKYLAAEKLSPEKAGLLKSWRDHHKKGMFFLLEYTPEYAVILVPGNDGDDRLYGVKGMTNSLAGVMRRRLPVQLETVLLPFRDKIIYDSFINTMAIHLGEGILKAIGEWRKKAATHELITKMD
jgi:hypothetical protein